MQRDKRQKTKDKHKTKQNKAQNKTKQTNKNKTPKQNILCNLAKVKAQGLCFSSC